jgi:hypothetical protein
MVWAKVRTVGDPDHLVPETHQRPFAISTSTKGIANMVTNVSIVTLSITGIRERVRMGKVEMGDQPLREDRKLLVEREITTATGG